MATNMPTGWVPWTDLANCVRAYGQHTDTYATGTWTDRAGNQDLTQGTAANRPSEVSTYLDFDGVNDNISHGDALVVDATGSITVACAVRPGAGNTGWPMSKSNATGTGWRLENAGASGWKWTIETSGAAVSCTSDAAAAVATIDILVCTRDSANVLRMWRNGAIQADKPFKAGNANNVAWLTFGADNTGAANLYVGRMYGALIFNRALLEEEVLQVTHWFDRTFSFAKNLGWPGQSAWRWSGQWSPP